MLWRSGTHMLAKLLWALGVSTPPGIEAYTCGPGTLVYNGLVTPVCQVVSGMVWCELGAIGLRASGMMH